MKEMLGKLFKRKEKEALTERVGERLVDKDVYEPLQVRDLIPELERQLEAQTGTDEAIATAKVLAQVRQLKTFGSEVVAEIRDGYATFKVGDAELPSIRSSPWMSAYVPPPNYKK